MGVVVSYRIQGPQHVRCRRLVANHVATFKVDGVASDEVPSSGTRELQRDVVYLCWPIIAPSYSSPKAGDGGWGCGVSANEYICAHHVTWSPNKLWRSMSIFNLCPARSSHWSEAI